MTIRKKAILFLSSGCGLGYMPFAPGTFGTLAALPICWLMAYLTWPVVLISFVALLVASIWIAGQAEQMLPQKDPGIIVIDEICGLVVALIGLPFTFFNVSLGFVLFRVFDITKPIPIRTLERRLGGGIGIVLDDVAAGIIANITLRIILYIFEI